MKKLLVLGGTRFIGRVFIETLLNRGFDRFYEITLCNRGKSAPSLFPNLKTIALDREADDMQAITSKEWDYVVDFSSYFPNTLADLLSAWKGRVGRYIFISTVSVYDLKPVREGKIRLDNPIEEDFPRKSYTKEDRVNPDMITYGERKVACEDELLAADWLDSIILRPSLVYGQYDYTDRYYYWLQRVRTQQQILVPDGGKTRLNSTFVDDFIQLIINCLRVDQHRTIYNASTHEVCSLQDILRTTAQLMQCSPKWIFLDKASQSKHGLSYNRDGFPLVYGGDYTLYNHDRALEDFDLGYHDLTASLQKTIQYYAQQDNAWTEGSYGLRLERAKEIIQQLAK